MGLRIALGSREIAPKTAIELCNDLPGYAYGGEN
jgi:hypothetical protein